MNVMWASIQAEAHTFRFLLSKTCPAPTGWGKISLILVQRLLRKTQDHSVFCCEQLLKTHSNSQKTQQ